MSKNRRKRVKGLSSSKRSRSGAIDIPQWPYRHPRIPFELLDFYSPGLRIIVRSLDGRLRMSMRALEESEYDTTHLPEEEQRLLEEYKAKELTVKDFKWWFSKWFDLIGVVEGQFIRTAEDGSQLKYEGWFFGYCYQDSQRFEWFPFPSGDNVRAPIPPEALDEIFVSWAFNNPLLV